MKSNILNSQVDIINDTNKYVVVIDYYFGLVDSLAEAKAIVKTAIPNGIDDSVHGICGIYSPNTSDKPYFGVSQKLSELQPIDISGYAQKRTQRLSLKYKGQDMLAGKCWLPVRLSRKKAWEKIEASGFLFGDEDIKAWTLEYAIAEWQKSVPNATIDNYSFREDWR